MSDYIKNIKISRSDLRNFGLAIGGFLIIFGLFTFVFNATGPFLYFIASGIILLVIALILPTIFKPFYKPWMILSFILGWLTTRIFLGIIFYVIITPIGIIARLLGKKFLDVKVDTRTTSYWNYRPIGEDSRKNYEKQF